eukprot:scaffold2984_cov80-Cylindrotheca_fusiformis.AAC.4
MKCFRARRPTTRSRPDANEKPPLNGDDGSNRAIRARVPLGDNLEKTGTPVGRHKRKRTAGGNSKSPKSKGRAEKFGDPKDATGQRQHRPWLLWVSAGKHQSSHGGAIARVWESRSAHDGTSDPREGQEACPRLGRLAETGNGEQHPRVEGGCAEEGNLK